MVTAAVCQPLAANPANSVPFALSSSRWKGCGSNWPANALICAASMTWVALANRRPTARSSR